ncbi:MAG: hypothetical protein K8U57_27785 [Planctomycetes bacterium]|nr:hypothetical protein [Planctomycetota bacterium]
MARVLVVTNPFGGRSQGDRITDASEIEEILSGEHASHVVRAEHAETPSSKPSKN